LFTITVTSNINATSKVSVQLFEHSHGRNFSALPTATAVLNAQRYAHLVPSNILMRLFSEPELVNVAGSSIAPKDKAVFEEMLVNLPAIKLSMRLFKKRG
jgi:hypothetical protein